MAHRYRGGRVAPGTSGNDQLARLGEPVVADYRSAMDRFALHEGAAAAFRLIDGANEFIAATAPWTLAKDPASCRSAVAGAVRCGGSDPPRARCCSSR